MKVEVNSTQGETYPYLAEDSETKNVYIVFSGPLYHADVMCMKVVDNHLWEVFERRIADGRNLKRLPEGYEVKITQ